ncbi:SDR family oxidoreductase [Rhodococcus ruber]|uniref:Short chain dehydrogenase n=1 Tax=Rhodococcus ruber TaxID=1830 RepID=A0A098BRD9_9NOCA|nr:SDR family oxidoreductase [Rhodococcus ruber]MBP2210409.1 NAD(P)-dependent dehydrogenase (short-subunit alcohol dehydrogenase family) [Rhodococcus ruber]MCD2126772.1 SDR family oxidoreductase [Rhodococcus ruber]MCZ4503651.1 SDR family oxidoreductase [Rhodococcus ruber]MCZ4532235.1 SDR family oxidoreductase [Rhodococcus ruber]MCZ4619194.1 SDR family oxidoreductase [Rhodococcus ruber]
MAIKDLRGRKFLVTGAASGIGRALALAAAAEGAELVLTDLAADGLDDTVHTVRERGGSVLHAAALDVSDYDAVTAFAADVHERAGALDVVANVAGTSVWGTVDALEHRHWKQMVDVNLMGPIHVIENFVPPMIEAGRGGHLVNVSSAAGLLALPWHAAYSASKFGLRGVSEVLRFDLHRHRIGVSLVVPGAVRTPLVNSVQIVGVDRDHPAARKLTARFERHAASPEKVAGCILAGIRKNRFLVYTSFDVRFGYWWARKFAPPYNVVMQLANNYFSRTLEAVRTRR